MIRYLLCGLDSENYTDASFQIFDSFRDAFESARKYPDDIGEKMTVEIDPDHVRLDFTSIDNGAYDYDEFFYSLVILPIRANDDEFICVKHHAYDGVGFSLVEIGTYDECRDAMKNDYENYSEFIDDDPDAYIDESGAIVDTGNEWLVWSIIKVGEHI